MLFCHIINIVQYLLNVVKHIVKLLLNISLFFIDNIKQNDDNIDMMTQEQLINVAIAYRGMSQATVAREIGMTPSNFNQKLKRETFTNKEMGEISGALGASYNSYFEFPNGVKFGTFISRKTYDEHGQVFGQYNESALDAIDDHVAYETLEKALTADQPRKKPAKPEK